MRAQVTGVIVMASICVLAAAQTGRGAVTGLAQLSRTPKTFASLQDAPRVAAAVADKAKNQITLGNDAVVLVEAGPAGNMLSFDILGLTNPEIVVHRGATVTFVVINVDDDEFHNFVLTDHAPPYAKMTGVHLTVGTTGLEPHKNGPYHGETLVVKADAPAHDFYLCTVPGHAAAGMFGKITVTP